MGLTVGLAVSNDSSSPKQGTARRLVQVTEPVVRLAATTAMLDTSAISGRYRYPHHKDHHDVGETLSPALLVSYVYLKPFLANRHRYCYRDWVMDSGAFSARQ